MTKLTCLPLGLFGLSLLILSSCGSGEKKESNAGATEAPTPGEISGIPETPSGTPTGAAPLGPTETTGLAVYAIWQPGNDVNTNYDGLYDSSSGYMQLCQTKEVVKIEKPEEVHPQNGNHCFQAALQLATITIRTGQDKPVFLDVVDVDSVNQGVVAISANHDTLAISVKTLPAAHFNDLKVKYREAHRPPQEIRKMQEFYIEDKKTENQQAKERLMRVRLREQ